MITGITTLDCVQFHIFAISLKSSVRGFNRILSFQVDKARSEFSKPAPSFPKRMLRYKHQHSFYCTGAIMTILAGSLALRFDLSWRALAMALFPLPVAVGIASIYSRCLR
jgi:hypothetical protein